MAELLSIEKVVYRGLGLSRDGGSVTFVDGALPGEKVIAEIKEEKKGYRRAELVSVLVPSPHRISPCCRTKDGTRIPGAVYDHVSYEEELKIKEGQLREFFRKTACFPPLVPVNGSPKNLAYRNKAVFHAGFDAKGNFATGYLGEDNRTIVPMESCPLSSPEINEAYGEFLKNAKGRLKAGESATFRSTPVDGAVYWTGRKPPKGPMLTERLPCGEFLFPPAGFFQVNRDVASILAGDVAAWLVEEMKSRGKTQLLDLYCGVGFFSLNALSSGFGKIVGVESGKAAIAAAKRNASLRRASGVSFYADMAENAPKNGFYGIDPAKAIVLLDPPRAGAQASLLGGLAQGGFDTVVYVSCNPATLARDAGILSGYGFGIGRISLYDMFPRTHHFETACLLSKSDAMQCC